MGLVKLSERICEGCGQAIIRNLAEYDGILYHYGCLNRTRAKPDYQCENCFGYWSRGRLGTVLLDNGASKSLVCPSCGALGLRKLNRKTEVAAV